MKKWNNPELLSLGVDMTMEDNFTTYAPPTHGTTNNAYCHAGHNDENGLCNGTVNDHSASGNKNHLYTGIDCPDHGPGNEACCCYGIVSPS